MAQLNVLLKATAQDKGVRKFFRDATKAADKFAVSAERAAQAGRSLGGMPLQAPGGRTRRGRAAAPRSRADGTLDKALRDQARSKARQSKRDNREAERAVRDQIAASKREAQIQRRQLRARERQSRNVKNLSDEQLTQLEVEREITRRRRRDAKRRAQDQVGPDPGRRGATPFQRFEVAENLAVAGGVFEDFGAQVETGIRGSFDAFKDFERGVVEVSTLTEDIPIEQIRSITQAAAEEFGGLPTDQVSAFYAIVSAGATDAASAQDQLNAANKLAIAGAASQESSVLAISKAVANFGSQGVTSAKAADSLFIAVQKGQTTVEEMARALPIVAQSASTAGLSIDETNAALAVLSKRFPRSSEGASALRQALSSIAKPTKAASDEAKKLGIDFSTAGIQAAGGLEEFLLKLRAAEGFDEDTLAQLFESTEARAAIGGLIDGLDELNATTQASVKGQGAVSKAFDKTSKTAAQQTAKLEAQFELLKIQAGEALVPALLDLADVAGPLLKNLTDFIKENPNVAKTLGVLAVQAAVFGRAAGVVVKALSAWNTLGGLTELGMGKLAKTTGSATSAATGMSKATSGLGMAAGALPAVFVGAQLAILAFNAVLDKAQGPLNDYEKAIDGVAEQQKNISFLDEKGQEKSEEQLLLERRNRLIDVVNASRTAEREAAVGGVAEDANVAQKALGGLGGILNKATGVQGDLERQRSQAERDLERFDVQFGEQIGLTQQQQFATGSEARGDGVAAVLAANAQAQLDALNAIANNTQGQPWQGPSLDAGLT